MQPPIAPGSIWVPIVDPICDIYNFLSPYKSCESLIYLSSISCDKPIYASSSRINKKIKDCLRRQSIHIYLSDYILGIGIH